MYYTIILCYTIIKYNILGIIKKTGKPLIKNVFIEYNKIVINIIYE